MAGLSEMARQAVDLGGLGRRVDALEDRVDNLAAADSIGPTFTTITAGGVVEENEGPPGPEGPEGGEGPPGTEGKEGKQGKEGAEGKQGKEGPAGAEGTPKPLGTYETQVVTWAKGAGTSLLIDHTPSFIPQLVLMTVVRDGPFVTGAVLTAAHYEGRLLSQLGTLALGQHPTIEAWILSTTPAAWAPFPRLIELQRSAENNTKAGAKIYITSFAFPGASTFAAAGGEKADGKGTISNNEGIAATFPMLIGLSYYTRFSPNLPTSQSDLALFNTLAEYEAGKQGAAGAQIYFPSLAERNAGTKHICSWTFPNVIESENIEALRRVTGDRLERTK